MMCRKRCKGPGEVFALMAEVEGWGYIFTYLNWMSIF
jgi:hypothetical protein